MNARSSQVLLMLAVHRRILADLVGGAVLIRRFGGFETYAEIDGKVKPCGNRMQERDLDSFLDAIPDLLPLRPDLGNAVLRLPSACRNAYADMLQQTMPLAELITEIESDARPRMRSAA